MKLPESSSRRPNLPRSGEAFRVESAAEENFFAKALLNTALAKKVREWTALPEAQLDTDQKLAILNSWWMGLLDPAYGQELRSLPWLKDFAYTEVRTLYAGTHESYGGFQNTGTPEDIRSRELFHQSFAVESTIASLQLFPEARQELSLGSALYPGTVADQLIAKHAKNADPNERILKAIQLLQIWPSQHEKILNDLVLSQGGDWLKKMKHTMQKNISYPAAIAAVLLLFPELRPTVKEIITTSASELVAEYQKILGRDKKIPNIFMATTWPLAVLAAEEARIDGTGRLELKLKRPALAQSNAFPVRSTL